MFAGTGTESQKRGGGDERETLVIIVAESIVADRGSTRELLVSLRRGSGKKETEKWNERVFRNGGDNSDDGDGVNDGSSCRVCDVKLEKERGEGREGERKEERKRR